MLAKSKEPHKQNKMPPYSESWLSATRNSFASNRSRYLINNKSSSLSSYSSKKSSQSTTPNESRLDYSLPQLIQKQSNNNKPQNTYFIDCDCVLCVRKNSIKRKNLSQCSSLIDGKHFLSSLGSLKTTSANVSKSQIRNYFVEDIYATLEQNIKDEDENEKTTTRVLKGRDENVTNYKLVCLSKTSKIKLWSPKDVSKFMADFKDDEKAEFYIRRRRGGGEIRNSADKKSSNSLGLNESDLNNRINLIRLFKELRLNPNLSPLLNSQNVIFGESDNDNENNVAAGTNKLRRAEIGVDLMVPPTTPLMMSTDVN